MLQDFSEADEAVTRSKKGYHDGQKNKVSKIQEETVSLASQTQMRLSCCLPILQEAKQNRKRMLKIMGNTVSFSPPPSISQTLNRFHTGQV